MSISGYFTTVGHKGCSPHKAGCTCTDTMKCNQINHPEWWPKPGAGECRPELSGYGKDFYPTTNCAGVVGNDPSASTYGGPPGRFGTGAGVGAYSMGFYKYYGPQNPKYAGFPKRHCSSTCDCTSCANKTIASNCQGKDSKDGHPCDCSFGNMKHGCWDDNCTGGNSTCDCTRCANTPIGQKCKGIDSLIPGFQCECGLPDAAVCWNYNCCPQGTKAPGPNDAGPIRDSGGTPTPSTGGGGTVKKTTGGGSPSTRPTTTPSHSSPGNIDGGGSLPGLSINPNLILYGGAGLILLFIVTGFLKK